MTAPKKQPARSPERAGEATAADTPGILQELTKRKRFCCWSLQPNPRGKPTKVPDQSTLQLDACRSWGAVADVPRTAAGGVGFVLTKGIQKGGITLCCLDVDGCRDPVSGTLTDWAAEIVREFNTGGEVSASGTGLHLWFGTRTDLRGIRTKVRVPHAAPPGVEKTPELQLFGTGPACYVALTFTHLDGTPDKIQLVDLTAFLAKWGFERVDFNNATALPVGWGEALTFEAIRAAVEALPHGQELLAANWQVPFPNASASEAYFSLVGRVLRAANGHGKRAVAFLLSTAWGHGEVHDSADASKYGRESWVTAEVIRAANKSDAAQNPAAVFEPLDALVTEQKPPVDMRPQIVLHPGRLAEVTREAEDALIMQQWAAGSALDNVYQRDGSLVRIVRTEGCEQVAPGATIAAHVLTMHPVAAVWLRAQFERAADFVKLDGRSKKSIKYAKRDCPDDVPALYLQQIGEWQLDQLTAIVHAPTMRPDGTVLQEPGYDQATGIIYEPCGVTFPWIKEAPSRDDARVALQELLEPVRLFPFASPHDRSVWIAAVLTAVVRAMLPTAPMVLFDSPVAGSGKTLLSMLVAIIVTGAEPSMVMHVEDDVEQKKRLFALLLRGVPVVCIDNVVEQLKGASLCSVLTSPVIEDRILSASRTATVSTRCTLLATGNNVVVKGDLVRRVLVCKIDPQVERPEERKFPFEPTDYARQHRPKLVAAALTILRAHAVAGRPVPDGLTPFGSFETWSNVVRAALVWVGEADPVLGRQTGEAARDEEHLAIAALAQAWHQAFGDHAVTVREAMNGSSSISTVLDALDATKDDLQLAFTAVGGDDPRTRAQNVGQRIVAAEGRVFGGLRFVGAGKAREGVRLWRVAQVGADRSAATTADTGGAG